MPLDDLTTYELLGRGETIGVFQLESGPMRSLIRSLKPTCFDDVAALVALYRPGPMAANMHNDYADRKNDRKPVQVFHEDAAGILGDTYGLMIYQESVMRVAQRFAGYSLADADNLRKACGKKDRKLMAKERDSFVQGCENSGYGTELGTELFDIIEQFADYAFTKSHAYGYGLIAYQGAYLKACYPVEYMAALLTSVKNKLEKAAVYLAECRQMGIKVALPDVNVSESDFAAIGAPNGEQAISFGLSAIRHMGAGTAQMILEERAENGPFADFYDFCSRVDPIVLNKGVVEALIKAGSFDSLGHPRQGLLNASETIVRRSIQQQRRARAGGDEPVRRRQPSQLRRAHRDPRYRVRQVAETGGGEGNAGPLRVRPPHHGHGGVLGPKDHPSDRSAVRYRGGHFGESGRGGEQHAQALTRKGDQMASCDLEDMYGSMEVTLFPRAMEEHGHKLEDDLVVVLEGRLDRRDDEPGLICFGVEPIDPAVANGHATLRLNLTTRKLTPDRIDSLKSALAGHPGKSEVILVLGADKGIKLSSAYGVDTGSGLIGELREMLGENAIAV